MTSIQSVFQKVDLYFEGLAKSKNVPVKFRATNLVILSDAHALERIVENLVSNAIKFTRGAVLVAARRTSLGVTIEVWDQGEGIRRESRDRIFEEFHQEPGVRLYAGPKAGVGLGLAFVKRLAAQLGYRVGLESAIGKGSVFKIFVPENAVLLGGAEAR